jgi:hypothetical protein
LISRVKSIVIIIIIIIINLDQISPSRPKKLGAGKDVLPKLLGCCRSADPNLLGLETSLDPRLCVLRKDSILMGLVLQTPLEDRTLHPSKLGPEGSIDLAV